MKVAAAAYPLDEFSSWAEYEDKLSNWVAEAAHADLLVFPEYGALELAAIARKSHDLEASLHAVHELLPRADALHGELAKAHDIYILAASGPSFEGARPVNRARFFAPSGAQVHQDKQMMTRFERDPWGVVSGGPLGVFETELGPIGVLICYDAEFPLLARALVEAGAEILLVPSCTDSLHVYHRVRVGAMSRALENQCVAVHSVTVGAADWCPAVDQNHGAAAICGPPDIGFPANGIIAEGQMDRAGWTFAGIDRAQIARTRQDGAQANHAHWAEQSTRLAQIRRLSAC